MPELLLRQTDLALQVIATRGPLGLETYDTMLHYYNRHTSGDAVRVLR